MALAAAVPAATAEAGYIGTVGDNQCLPYTNPVTHITVFFCDADYRPTGTGFIDPFLRTQRDGTTGNPSDNTASTYSSAWNTDARHQDGVDGFNDFDHSWTSALELSDVNMNLMVPGTNLRDYALFSVDINQAANQGSNLLSLNQLAFYNCDSNDYIALTPAEGCTEFLDVFAGTTDFVNFNYLLHSGSGAGDIDIYVPDSGFTGEYIALLDGWGCGSGAGIPSAYRCNVPNIIGDNDGFQEWWRTTSVPQPTVPEPASLLLLGSGLSAAAVARRRNRKKVS